MQIPFEVDPPEKVEKEDDKSENLSLKVHGSSQRLQESLPNQQQKPLTVTQLTRQIALLLEGKFGSLILEAELSNVKKATSGHWYFSLIDDNSQIRGVMFRNAAAGLRFEPYNGLEVVVRGKITVYQLRGDYQIMISSMEPKGLGALQLAFEQLKDKLEAEGLFDAEQKKSIPFLPRKIGIVTSSTGAVIHDMMTVLERRFKGIPVLLFPTSVQGDSAVPSIVEGIKQMNIIRKSAQIDVLIVGRGGGSMEDLWAFNNEKLARAIFSSEIPVISAVGHETDFTIADFVSDLRAPTPSAALELAVPNKKDLKYTVSQKRDQLQRTLLQILERLRGKVDAVLQRLDSPSAALRQYAQRVDDLESLLQERIKRKFENLRVIIYGNTEKLFLLSPEREFTRYLHSLKILQERLVRAIELQYKKRNDSVCQQMDLLESLSPLSVMHRGYSVVLDKSGNSLRSAKKIHPGEDVQVRMLDGSLRTKVISVKTKQ